MEQLSNASTGDDGRGEPCSEASSARLQERELPQLPSFRSRLATPFNWKSLKLPPKTNVMAEAYNAFLNYTTPDCFVYVGNYLHRCHLVVLQSRSRFFEKFESGDNIELPESKVTPSVFVNVYDWMIDRTNDYESVFNRTNILDLLLAAQFLDIRELEEQCWALINSEKVFSEDTAFLLYLMARRRGLAYIMEMMKHRITKFFLPLVASPGFVLLPLDVLRVLLSSNHVQVHCEAEIFMAGVRWLVHAWPKRKKYVIPVMSCVRFGLIPACQLVDIRRNPANKEFLAVTEPQEVQAMITDGLAFSVHSATYPPNSDAYYEILRQLDIIEPEDRFWIQPHLTYRTYKEFLKTLKYISRYSADCSTKDDTQDFRQVDCPPYDNSEDSTIKPYQKLLETSNSNDSFTSSSLKPPQTLQFKESHFPELNYNKAPEMSYAASSNGDSTEVEEGNIKQSERKILPCDVNRSQSQNLIDNSHGRSQEVHIYALHGQEYIPQTPDPPLRLTRNIRDNSEYHDWNILSPDLKLNETVTLHEDEEGERPTLIQGWNNELMIPYKRIHTYDRYKSYRQQNQITDGGDSNLGTIDVENMKQHSKADNQLKSVDVRQGRNFFSEMEGTHGEVEQIDANNSITKKKTSIVSEFCKKNVMPIEDIQRREQVQGKPAAPSGNYRSQQIVESKHLKCRTLHDTKRILSEEAFRLAMAHQENNLQKQFEEEIRTAENFASTKKVTVTKKKSQGKQKVIRQQLHQKESVHIITNALKQPATLTKPSLYQTVEQKLAIETRAYFKTIPTKENAASSKYGKGRSKSTQNEDYEEKARNNSEFSIQKPQFQHHQYKQHKSVVLAKKGKVKNTQEKQQLAVRNERVRPASVDNPRCIKKTIMATTTESKAQSKARKSVDDSERPFTQKPVSRIRSETSISVSSDRRLETSASAILIREDG